MRNLPLDTIAVIDFETTGLSPAHGERATEIAAVLVRDGRIIDRYQSLMNAGRRVPPFIEALAGLPSAAQAHRALADAEMAAHLTLYLERELQRRFGLATVTHALLERIQKAPKSGLQRCVERYGLPCK